MVAVEHCTNKSSWGVFELSLRASAVGTWCPWWCSRDIGSFGWQPLLVPLLCLPLLVVQMSNFLRPHMGALASSVTCRRRVVRIRS